MTMKTKLFSNEDAVSPVVGVMLMLVVTIIIAAVVSGFAGGLVETQEKAPQITLIAEAHDGSHILIEHLGGDPLDTGSVTVRTYIPAGSFSDLTYKVANWSEQTYCPTNQPLYASWSWAVFQPGDQIKINWDDAFADSKRGGKMAPGAGEPVNIEIYTKTGGKLVVTAQTIVLP